MPSSLLCCLGVTCCRLSTCCCLACHVLQNCPRGMPHSSKAQHLVTACQCTCPPPLCLPVLPLFPSLRLSLLIAYINVTTCLCRKRVARFRFDVQRVVRAALCMRSTLLGGGRGQAQALACAPNELACPTVAHPLWLLSTNWLIEVKLFATDFSGDTNQAFKSILQPLQVGEGMGGKSTN